MAIFDIEKDELLRLSDIQLEELIARLAEAEVAANGHSPAWVSWSGSINAADEGIDIHVKVPANALKTGFLEKPNTILQAKKHRMPRGSITKEMVNRGQLSPTISKQASKGGGYIIVSLKDDCSPPRKAERISAMMDAVKDDPNSRNIHLDFYDRSKLVQWVRQHPSVMLWVKGKLGQGYSGWQPYGAWSNPPKDEDDTLISAPGVTVTLPSGQGQKLAIEYAIEPIRDLIRSTKKAVRITGLSGVGKTRIVQALFEETVGTNALDRTVAVYVDTGADPDPSAAAMLDRLIAEGRRAIIILDNCPSELHSALASKVSAAGNKVSLITVEYDIKESKPQTTEVIHIEAVGPEVAEQLLIRRFPRIGQNNARRIAEFADGNARVSLVIAERVEEGESLALLSDDDLFNRLFEQRKRPDDDLRQQAEALSLVYSFSVSNMESGNSELEVLGSIFGYSHTQLFRSVKKLMDRHIMQKRAHWRAILPHAIANKLAASALDSIPVDQLKATFESTGNPRLLMSFAHRLGLLHDHPVAKEIVEAWLQPDGLLGRISTLEDTAARMLNYVAPVAPEALLDRIETELTLSDFEGMGSPYNTRRRTILNLLQSLAYEKSAFERCARLLIRVADLEDESNNYDAVRNKITSFFQAYLSGTHASLDQRIAIMDECLSSGVAERRSLGFRMLSTALNGPPWTGVGATEFGARPRDFGFQPNHDELVEWRSAFVDVAVRLGTSGNSVLEDPARPILANAFRGIWRQKAMREKLIDAARRLHAHQAWSEGWKAVRSTIYFDYIRRKDEDGSKPLPVNLAALDKELEPHDLIPKIMANVLSAGHDCWALDDFNHDDTNKYRHAEERLAAKALRLGEDFAASNHELNELGSNLFSNNRMSYRAAFGRGLAKGAHNLRVGWRQLVAQLEQQPEASRDFAVFGGFIEEADSVEPELAQELLDQCAQHPELRNVLVGLHPRREFTKADLDRCMALLDDPDTCLGMYGQILWRDDYASLPRNRIIDLAWKLLSKPNGDDVVLDALSVRLHGKNCAVDTLGSDLRLVGLKAAIQRLQRGRSDPGEIGAHHMECVIGATLSFEGNEAEKIEWLDTIFAVVDEHYGHIYAFENAIETTAELMPCAFLNRVFEGTEEEQDRRLFFIRHGGLLSSPLAKVDVGILIEWCRSRNDNGVWEAVAAGINLWSGNEDQRVVAMSASAIKLLEASPEPEEVLEVFAERIILSSWSGSRANMVQSRADAIAELAEHKNVPIAKASKSVSAKLVEWVEREKVREQQEDEKREQRFE
ncbi:hypothetical protein [Vreelandella venusta]|uniref:hypothetical protein n=1 Tax=Vreelandella venusta TaxID=44935 RepID=UPI00116AD257|nr:hypothetical protein [Halomonas venusta]GEK51822.1 hypothetical protein HVE01_25430 [Halomonas venusta]